MNITVIIMTPHSYSPVENCRLITVESFKFLGGGAIFVDCGYFAYLWGFIFVDASIFSFSKKSDSFKVCFL